MGWKTKEKCFLDGDLPPEMYGHVDCRCKCTYALMVSDNLKRERCSNPCCPYHLAARVEVILKQLGVTGIGYKTALSLVNSLKLEEAIEIVPKYLKRKPRVHLWQVAKLSRIEGIDNEWATILGNVQSREDYLLVQPKYRQYLDEIFDNAEYFDVIKNTSKETVCIAIHEEIMGFANKEDFVNRCNMMPLCMVNTVLKSSISRYTRFLVTEHPNDSCIKVREAKKRGQDIINPSEYLDYLAVRSIELGATIDSEMED